MPPRRSPIPAALDQKCQANLHCSNDRPAEAARHELRLHSSMVSLSCYCLRPTYACMYVRRVGLLAAAVCSSLQWMRASYVQWPRLILPNCMNEELTTNAAYCRLEKDGATRLFPLPLTWLQGCIPNRSNSPECLISICSRQPEPRRQPYVQFYHFNWCLGSLYWCQGTVCRFGQNTTGQPVLNKYYVYSLSDEQRSLTTGLFRWPNCWSGCVLSKMPRLPT